jgi:hypothetical protein
VTDMSSNSLSEGVGKGNRFYVVPSWLPSTNIC